MAKAGLIYSILLDIPTGRELSNLERLHTKTLMRFLKVFQSLPQYNHYEHEIHYKYIQFDHGDQVILTSRDQVKAVLDTREHVPNKQEAKLKRQQKHGTN